MFKVNIMHEYHAWLDADSKMSEDSHPQYQTRNTQAGSWTADSHYSGYGCL